ncbi:MAG TPA: zinc ribbon domain-containing protein [Pyrinomonadaceae bacterium]
MEPTMHCPGCGTEAPVTQKFCRSCGFSLEKVPQLVAEQLSESEEILHLKAAEKLQRRQQLIDHWLSITGIGFITLIALSALIGLIYLMFAGNLPIVPGIVLLLLILGGFVAGSLAMYSEKLKKSLSGSSSLRSRPLPERQITSTPALEAFEGPFVSVTERTTNLLDKDDAVEPRNERRKKP